MEIETLCAAVWEAPDYLRKFTRRDYTGAFRAYTERFGPLFMVAVREEKNLPQRMMDALEAAWAKQHIWNRSAVRVNEKQMIVNYLSPMLLGLEEPLCSAFAEDLCRTWAARRPKDAYRITDYATIQDGFRNVIMGMDLAGKHIDEK
ncbi:MAG: hypothetical protein RR035_01520 [Oscillibacter sp.]